MSISINIHPDNHPPSLELAAYFDSVSWDNGNCVSLYFGSKGISIFNLDDATAELLHLVASMTIEQRRIALEDLKTAYQRTPAEAAQ